MKIFHHEDYKKLFWAFIFLCIFVAGGVWFLNRNIETVPVSSETTENTDWVVLKTFTDRAHGVSFKYAEIPSISYIGPLKWPPQIEINKTIFSCVEGGLSIGSLGKIEKRTINGHQYCVTTLVEGAMGSKYTTYSYTWSKDNFVPTLSFTIRSVSCVNYDESKKSQCEQQQALFDIDTIVDKIAQSVTISL
jgi:hypothetical protein